MKSIWLWYDSYFIYPVLIEAVQVITNVPWTWKLPRWLYNLFVLILLMGTFTLSFVLFTQEHMFQTTFSTSWFAISDCAKSQCTEVTHNVCKYVHNAAQLAQSSLQQGAYNLLLILPIPNPTAIVLLVCEWESYEEWFQPDSESENWTPTYSFYQYLQCLKHSAENMMTLR